MSTTVKTGWLKDKEGNKFAPKTLISQVQTNDGVLLEDKIQADLNAAKEEILSGASGNINVDDKLSSTSENPVQNKVVTETTNMLESAIDTKADKTLIVTLIHDEINNNYTLSHTVDEIINHLNNGGSSLLYNNGINLGFGTSVLLYIPLSYYNNDCVVYSYISNGIDDTIETVTKVSIHRDVGVSVTRNGLLDYNTLSAAMETVAIYYETKENAQAKYDETTNNLNELTEVFSNVIYGIYGNDYDEESGNTPTIRDIAANEADKAKTYSDTNLAAAKSYTDTKTSGLASTSTVDTKISTHNTSTSAHNDIRGLITDLTAKLNNFLNVDDTTTDQLSEVLTLINNNKGTLESLTTTKINVSDIVNNLTTNNSSKVLSAAQGVVIQGLIDTLQEEVDSHTQEIANIQTTLNAKVPTSRTVNGKALSSNISLSASDVGAYTKTEIDDMVFITVEDIDAICGTSIQLINEVMF